MDKREAYQIRLNQIAMEKQAAATAS